MHTVTLGQYVQLAMLCPNHSYFQGWTKVWSWAICLILNTLSFGIAPRLLSHRVKHWIDLQDGELKIRRLAEPVLRPLSPACDHLSAMEYEETRRQAIDALINLPLPIEKPLVQAMNQAIDRFQFLLSLSQEQWIELCDMLMGDATGPLSDELALCVSLFVEIRPEWMVAIAKREIDACLSGETDSLSVSSHIVYCLSRLGEEREGTRKLLADLLHSTQIAQKLVPEQMAHRQISPHHAPFCLLSRMAVAVYYQFLEAPLYAFQIVQSAQKWPIFHGEELAWCVWIELVYRRKSGNALAISSDFINKIHTALQTNLSEKLSSQLCYERLLFIVEHGSDEIAAEVVKKSLCDDFIDVAPQWTGKRQLFLEKAYRSGVLSCELAIAVSLQLAKMSKDDKEKQKKLLAEARQLLAQMRENTSNLRATHEYAFQIELLDSHKAELIKLLRHKDTLLLSSDTLICFCTQAFQQVERQQGENGRVSMSLNDALLELSCAAACLKMMQHHPRGLYIDDLISNINTYLQSNSKSRGLWDDVPLLQLSAAWSKRFHEIMIQLPEELANERKELAKECTLLLSTLPSSIRNKDWEQTHNYYLAWAWLQLNHPQAAEQVVEEVPFECWNNTRIASERINFLLPSLSECYQTVYTVHIEGDQRSKENTITPEWLREGIEKLTPFLDHARWGAWVKRQYGAHEYHLGMVPSEELVSKIGHLLASRALYKSLTIDQHTTYSINYQRKTLKALLDCDLNGDEVLKSDLQSELQQLN